MENASLKVLSRKLIERRGSIGIRATAKEVGVSAATLSRVERGYLPDLETFAKICKWLEVDPAEVLGVVPQKSTPLPRVAVHFKKDVALAPETAQALAKMVLAAHRAWLVTESEA